MLFNTIDFAIFLPIVFLCYWFLFKNSLKGQNAFLVVASYFFYGWWDWRFLALIAFSSVVDYLIGIQLGKENQLKNRRLLLFTSIVVNLGFLGFFKYYNFFVDNFVAAFKFLGHDISGGHLEIILPVGISFYTFQTLSYSIDVYRKKLEPTTDIVSFFAFVSFFPQLVAGPIERASNLLPQFQKARVFVYEKASNGMRQVLWGLFKKMVIADNCAQYVNMVYAEHEAYGASSLLLAAILFAFQIYCDFSGYSDIAIGTSRLFGFDLKKNFAFPYFSRDIAEFWRRWHISLSTWFRDYLYIPLGGSRNGRIGTVVNIFIIFIVSGFWHGDKWTFIIWGALNALYFVPLYIFNLNRKNLGDISENRLFVLPKEAIQIVLTFGLTVIAWIFFRSSSVEQAFSFIKGLFQKSILTVPEMLPVFTLALLALFIILEWLGRHHEYGIEKLVSKYKTPVRWTFYISLAFIISIFSAREQVFIYFQF